MTFSWRVAALLWIPSPALLLLSVRSLRSPLSERCAPFCCPTSTHFLALALAVPSTSLEKQAQPGSFLFLTLHSLILGLLGELCLSSRTAGAGLWARRLLTRLSNRRVQGLLRKQPPCLSHALSLLLPVLDLALASW